ncbi:phenylacetic acid degradation bifunctional protein PaaZ [Flavobacteriales bacterium]|nr:phenylacetic acid degradation bifunctional protein PaaZ [Flavobacteriales bacterium]
MEIKNYVLGNWISGEGKEIDHINAITGEFISSTSSKGLDFKEILEYGRKKGSPALRKMTFQQRGEMLKSLALYLNKRKETFYTLSKATGATRIDSWIDIDGGIGNLFANASLRKQFPDLPYHVDGQMANLSKNGTFIGHHIMVPKKGVAVHINAFNFPIWGMLEKIAVNLMAGVAAVVKPSEHTSYLTALMVKEIINSKILPEGSLQLVPGTGIGILDYVSHNDVVSFTGSASTGKLLKSHPNILEHSVPFNMEADSLNACVLGTDVNKDSEEFEIFIKEVYREITVKTGQKCTAVRRILVPEKMIEDVQKSLIKKLEKTIIGDPENKSVRMGALASKIQVERVKENVKLLMNSQEKVYGDYEDFKVVDASIENGAFFSPILFRNNEPFLRDDVHKIEAFGPVSTLIPYKNMDEAVELVEMGKGSLVTSFVSNNDNLSRDFVVQAAHVNGRILVLNSRCSKESTGHGSPMPLLTHGGPGRAGGGEEMGGIRGIKHYLQRTAIQGHPETITRITEQFQIGANQPEAKPHVFRKHFEELVVGETVFTHKHTVTVSDIVNFANVSGDNFYAHMDETSLDETIFEQRVAHGYFILSKAAGLFVDPAKGPVLLNYGIDECRFTKPVYPGATIGVKFTVKEKIDQKKKDDEDISKGIVKFLVDIYDETEETVGIATILTMVKKIDQN